MSRMEFYEQIGVAVTCRSYEEYILMFACNPEEEREVHLLDVAGGASSFAAGARKRGLKAQSVDPVYSLDFTNMKEKAEKEHEEAEGKIAKLAHRFDWSHYGSAEEHLRRRALSLQLFLDDYRELSGTGAYLTGTLPELPFPDGSFTHVFCSHFLFLYAEIFSYDFHLRSILEMVRVCRPGGAVQVYPLFDLKWRPYPELDRLLGDLERAGLKADLIASKLPFIPASSQLLRITAE